MDWGLKNRLAHIIKPNDNRALMLAVDHGYFLGPTEKLEIPKKVRLIGDREPVDYETLPHINKTVKKDHGHYRDYFNERTRGLVEKYYKKDLEVFEYEF